MVFCLGRGTIRPPLFFSINHKTHGGKKMGWGEGNFFGQIRTLDVILNRFGGGWGFGERKNWELPVHFNEGEKKR